MADIGAQVAYGDGGPTVDNFVNPSTAANLVLVGVDTLLDSYTQRRISTELDRTSVEVYAAFEKAKICLLDYIANLNS